MSLQRKVATVLIVSLLSIGLVGELVAFANDDLQYKTFTSEEFGFSISYPEDWNKEYRDKQEDVYPYFRLSSMNPRAMVTVTVIELAEPTSLNELKRFRELHAQIFNGSWGEIMIEEFAGLQAVTEYYTIVGKKMTTGEDRYEKWERNELKAKWIGLISNGYLYRITTRASQEEYEEVNEKYLDPILESFKLIQ